MSNKTFLHVLLVITFIFAGISCMSNFMMSLLQPSLQQYYVAHPEVLPEQFRTAMQTYFDVPRGYFLASGLLYLLEVIGGVLMWNLRPSGFHCYTMSRLLLILVPLLFLGKGFLGLGDIMMAALFIFVYWMLLKQLGAFGSKEEAVQSQEQSQEQNSDQE